MKKSIERSAFVAAMVSSTGARKWPQVEVRAS